MERYVEGDVQRGAQRKRERFVPGRPRERAFCSGAYVQRLPGVAVELSRRSARCPRERIGKDGVLGDRYTERVQV
jgi:hypothetical protein